MADNDKARGYRGLGKRILVSLLSVGLWMYQPIQAAASEDRNLGTAEVPSAATRIGVVLPIDSVEASILESLRQLGLFESAIARCQAAIATAPLGSLAHARWTAWLVETLAERDAQAADSISSALGRARLVYEAHLADEKHTTYREWSRYSFERVRYDLANRAVAGFLSAPTNTARRDDALETLRDVLKQLEQINTAVQERVGTVLRRSDRESASLARDLAALRNRIAFLEIDCLLLRSECYPPESVECIAAGTEALNSIERMAGQVESEWKGREQLELSRYRSLIALNRFDDALRGIEKWLPTVADTSIRNQTIAAAAGACLQQKDLENAVRYLSMAPNDALRQAPEIALAVLALQIAVWQKRETSSEGMSFPDRSQDRSIDLILEAKDQIADRFGIYWKQRAEALIVASSQLKSTSGASLPSSRSLELLKLEIRQLLAAGEIDAAVERLEQAEAAALAANDFQQAFALAQTAVGLLQQQAVDETSSQVVAADRPPKSTSDVQSTVPLDHSEVISKSTVLQEAIDRTAKVANQYFDQKAAPRLHQTAIELQKRLIAPEVPGTVLAKGWDRYRQLLMEHLARWPHEVTSTINRGQLQALYFGTGDLDAVVELWKADAASVREKENASAGLPSEESTERLTAARINMINAMLLSSLVRDLGINAVAGNTMRSIADDLSVTERSIYEALSGDFDWWTIDGGLRRADGQALSWSDAVSDSPNASVLTAVQRILLAAQRSPVSLIEPDLQLLVEWCVEDPLGRFGWMAAMNSKLSNILRLRALADWDPQERRAWAATLTRLDEVLESLCRNSAVMLHATLDKALSELSVIIDARTSALSGDEQGGIAILESLRKSQPRNPRWTLELARLYEMQASINGDQALQLYRQLAAGSKVGSDIWLESRLSSARCLRSLGKPKEANEVTALIQAMVAELPPHWKKRIK